LSRRTNLAHYRGDAHLSGHRSDRLSARRRPVKNHPRGRTNVAKGQKRSGREPKKPKQVKKPTPLAAPPVASATAKGKPGSGR